MFDTVLLVLERFLISIMCPELNWILARLWLQSVIRTKR